MIYYLFIYLFIYLFLPLRALKEINTKLYFKLVVIKRKVVTSKTMSYLVSLVLIAATVLYLLDHVPCSLWHVCYFTTIGRN